MKILVYGSINLDITFFVPHIVLPGETMNSKGKAIRPGGKGANQASAIALSGSECYLAGKINAKDNWILELLNSYKVNTDFVLKNGSHTGEATIQIADNGQNSIILTPGSNRELHKAEIDEVLENFTQGDILVIQNETNHINSLILKAKTKKLRIVFNPSPITRDLLNLPLDLVDMFFVNEIEARALANCDGDDETVLKKLSQIYKNAEIIMTLGNKGAFYRKGEYQAFCDIYPVKVLDTTCAGDTFLGYFLTSYFTLSHSIEDSLALASKSSSIAVSRIGSLESIPHKEEVYHNHASLELFD